MRMITTSKILIPLVMAMTISVSVRSQAGDKNERPNIIFILADDLGYMDVGAYALKVTGTDPSDQFYETPNINALVHKGVPFSQAYAAPLCSPTRAALLTGIYPSVWGFNTATPGKVKTFYNQGETPPRGFHEQDALHGDNLKKESALINGYTRIALPSGQPQDMGKDAITIAESLTDYQSAFMGKWHLGGHGSEGYQPHDQGFEEISYFDAGGSVYFDWKGEWDRKEKIFPKMRQDQLMRGRSGEETGEDYLTDDLTIQAVNYIDDYATGDRENPFFLYFCHFAVHSPLQALPKDTAYFKNKPTKGWNGHHHATYAAMVRSLDRSVGQIMNKLRETGLEENTLVVFMSDNGGVSWDGHKPGGPTTSNAPLKGGKAMVYEGGIRVPLIFYWKGKIEGGQWVDRPVDAVDIYPTLLEMAGYGHGKIDGQSLTSLMSDKYVEEYKRDTYYWHYPLNVGVKSPVDKRPLTPHSAIRKGDYKLIFDWYGRLSLYDISRDFEEKNNLVRQRPRVTKKLFGELMMFLEDHVEKKYWPKVNPEYKPDKEIRKRRFVDLYQKYKAGEDILAY